VEIRKIAAALFATVRHPVDVLRYALAVDRDDGAALGWWLRKGLSPSARRALGAAVLSDDDIVLEFEGDGYKWRAPTGDDIAVSLLSIGEYSGRQAKNLAAWLRAHHPRDGVVLDVGANIGTTSLPLATEGYRVFAYEPIPRTFEFLERNVEVNDMRDRVTCIQMAISDHEGTATMRIPHALGASRIVNAPSGDFEHVDVPVTTLVGALANAGLTVDEVGFVWCDAEGTESKVVAGGEPLWTAGVPIYAECGHDDADLPIVLGRYFESFVPEGEMRSLGTSASRHPISEIPSFLDSLTRLHDVLFLPR
jgi:FkbM family methyltransferase